MLAARMAHYVSRKWRFGQAADSHSCRDQGKTRSDSARDLSQMIRGQGGSGLIPTFPNTRARQDAARGQVISLGNIKRAHELLRPASEISQPETTTTQQQHNTFTPQAGTLEIKAGSGSRSTVTEEQPRHGLRTTGVAAAAAQQQESRSSSAPRPRSRSAPDLPQWGAPACRGVTAAAAAATDRGGGSARADQDPDPDSAASSCPLFPQRFHPALNP